MKSLAEQMRNYDRDQMRRAAQSLPDVLDEKPQIEQVAQVINGVFTQLLAAFPATTANRDQAEMNEIRRQWVLAFRENGITTMQQVAAGMRMARRQERPFLPSPGQFVAWCKEGEQEMAGLPKADELVSMVHDYCARRGYYDAPEAYPWEHPAHYWMVTSLYSGMRANCWTDSELHKKASAELVMMAARITRGEQIPEPKVMLPQMGGKPLGQKQGLEKIAEIRARFGMRRNKS